MDQPKVAERTWIKLANGIDAYVLCIDSGGLSVGYHQNDKKAIREDVVWDGSRWQFRHSGQSGSYLHGQDEMIVKKGPYR